MLTVNHAESAVRDMPSFIVSPTDMGLVSVIIPVYNAAPYLEQLITSVFAQTYSNIEVIAAYEEASTDISWDVLLHLKEIYPIILTTGSERCPGGTRNRGLSYAKGDFVVFVDADDYVLPDYLSSMLAVFSRYPELSVVSCAYLWVPNDTDLPESITKAQHSEAHIEKYDASSMIQMLFDGDQGVMPWLWMIRREYLLGSHLNFPTEYYGEDDAFAYSLVSLTSSVGKCTKQVYLQIARSSSITKTRREKWYDSVNSAYHYIPIILASRYPEYAQEYTTSLKRMMASFSAYEMSYVEWKIYLKKKRYKSY